MGPHARHGPCRASCRHRSSEPSEGVGPASRSASSSRSSGLTSRPREPSQLAGRKLPSESAYVMAPPMTRPIPGAVGSRARQGELWSRKTGLGW
eukprot:scaffold37342_cov63-Phaeocystis_antarctica.AAC.3